MECCWCKNICDCTITLDCDCYHRNGDYEWCMECIKNTPKRVRICQICNDNYMCYKFCDNLCTKCCYSDVCRSCTPKLECKNCDCDLCDKCFESYGMCMDCYNKINGYQ